ncbi:MAG: hypothetical protein AAF533_02210 [Acidobacteriota bacterium]
MSEGESRGTSCRECAEPIHAEATRCPHCAQDQSPWGAVRRACRKAFWIGLLIGGFQGSLAITFSEPAGRWLHDELARKPRGFAPEVVNPVGMSLLEHRVGEARSVLWRPRLVGIGRFQNGSTMEAWAEARLICEEPEGVSRERMRAWLGRLGPGETGTFRTFLDRDDSDAACESPRLELTAGSGS